MFAYIFNNLFHLTFVSTRGASISDCVLFKGKKEY